MPEIGATLREARMRARIDISEIEAETKIRAKYLRALENEEWDLLPGPTYVKSFLRSYADALGLDAKRLVEEYKARHERLSDVELQPISPHPGRERRRAPGPIVPRGAVVGAVVVALIVALYALGRGGDDGEPAPQGNTVEQPASEPAGDDGGARAEEAEAEAEPEPERPTRPESVRLQLAATGPVYVCLMGGDRTLVDGATLSAGEETEVFRSRRFRMVLGNNNVTLRINGQGRTVAASDSAIGLEITPRRGRQPLGEDELPDCT